MFFFQILTHYVVTYVETTHLEASRHTRNKERDEEGVLPNLP